MLFAIGDVHGHFEKLTDLMGHCRRLADAAEEQVLADALLIAETEKD